MPISIYDSIAGQTPRDYFLETEGPLASDDTFKTTPIQLGAMFFETQSADYEAKAGEVILADVEATGSFTVDLPAAPLANQRIGVTLETKSTDGRYVAVNPNGKNINASSANLDLVAQGDGVILQFTGSQWVIIADTRERFGDAKAIGHISGVSGAPSLAFGVHVAGLIDYGVGIYGVTMAREMADANFIVALGTGNREGQVVVTSSTSFTIYNRSSSGALADTDNVTFAVFGDLLKS